MPGAVSPPPKMTAWRRKNGVKDGGSTDMPYYEHTLINLTPKSKSDTFSRVHVDYERQC